MTSLPPEVPERLRYIAEIISAYNTCLILENTLQLAVDKGEDVSLRNKLVYVRILGYLIHYVPTNQGLKNTAKEISSCTDDSTLLDVGRMYYDHFIQACTFPNLGLTCDLDLTRSPVRANRSPIPTPPNHASCPSFDTFADMMNDTLVETPPPVYATLIYHILVPAHGPDICTPATAHHPNFGHMLVLLLGSLGLYILY